MTTISITELPRVAEAIEASMGRVAQHGARGLALIYHPEASSQAPFKTGYLSRSAVTSSPSARATSLGPGSYAAGDHQQAARQLPKGSNRPGDDVWTTHAPSKNGFVYSVAHRSRFQPQAHQAVLSKGPRILRSVVEDDVPKLQRLETS